MNRWDITQELPVMSYQLAATILCHQPPPMPVARSPWWRALGWLLLAGMWAVVVGAVWLEEGIS